MEMDVRPHYTIGATISVRLPVSGRRVGALPALVAFALQFGLARAL